MSGIETVVFDLDGTLVDSSHDIAGALNRVLVPMGGRELTAAETNPLLGEGVRSLVEEAMARSGVGGDQDRVDDVAAAYLAEYRSRPVADSTIYPGVRESLASLRAAEIPLGVCTNKVEAIALEVLDGLGIGKFFDVVVGADTVPRCKPHPDHLRETFIRLDRDPARGALVGDSVYDASAAAGVGVAFYAVEWAPDAVPGPRLTPFDQLVEIVLGSRQTPGEIFPSTTEETV